ncbi:ComEC/Rec2 family competence protein [Marinomonas sp. 15G1-11]|uniref:ComEC/Rec2 family competence protein n=1 Tax=Marinomonas phaeophyticola TaxID=3004091 RepID=A0ABT4JPC2_9GAMM|nr:ComEC/Rec2 family competence protein [Marinomonas sp. 15G1-11]MCZ2720220.1 ComEC/Rec2 family competence protein [Marinomonas sp. 15G1-11]
MLQHLFLWMGTDIVPDDFKCLYSTYILLLCLYLIRQTVRIENEEHLAYLISGYFLLTLMYQFIEPLLRIVTYIYDNLIIYEMNFKEIKSAVDSRFNQYPSWRFSRALLFGEKGLMDQSDKWVVQVLGVGHLFVVSGLHVGFLYAILKVLIRFLWCALPSQWLLLGVSKKVLEVFISIVLVVTYGSFVGWGPAVGRASVMLLLFNFMGAFHRSLTGTYLIALAFVIVLLIHPDNVNSAGFWLSFCLVFLIVNMTRLPLGLVFKAICTQAVLSVGSLVIIVGWQDYVSIYTMIVNLVVIPFTAFFWFPVGFFAVLEAFVTNSSWLMGVIDSAVLTLFNIMQFVAFNLYLIPMNEALPLALVIMALIGLVLSIIWFRWSVFFSVLLMGSVFLFVSHKVPKSVIMQCWLPNRLCPNQYIIIENINNKLLLFFYQKRLSEQELTYRVSLHLDANWFSSMREIFEHQKEVLLLDKNWKLLLWPSVNSKLTVKMIFEMLPDIVILSTMPDDVLTTRLDALKVAWAVVKDGEAIVIEEDLNSIEVNLSRCHFLWLSRSEALCERIEMINSMVN